MCLAEHNLNVMFELGFRMDQDKPVFLLKPSEPRRHAGGVWGDDTKQLFREQTHPFMHGLKICCCHVCVPLGRLQVGMPHYFLQAEDVPAPTQIAGCECVPSGMEGAAWCGESQ